MATSGALSGFLNAMLELRSQRLKEAAAKAQAQEEMMKGIGEGIGSLGKGIGAAMKQGREDTSANQLMNQLAPPRAQAVGPNAAALNAQAAQAPLAGQVPYDEVPATMAPFAGGKAGLDQRMEVEKMRQGIAKSRAADLWKQKNYELAERGLAIRQAAETRQASKASYANQLMEKAPQAAKDILTTSLAVQAKQDNLMEQMQKDMANDDFESYQAHAREMRGYQEVHKGAKLSSAMKDIPPFISARQAKLFADATANQEDITGAWMDPKATGLPENKASYSLLSGGPKRAPANTPLDPAMVNRMAQRGQFTPQEAAMVGGGPPPAAGTQAPAPRPAPGAGPLIYKNKTTGARAVWNPQTGKMEPLPAGQ
jgi:hypothetical protein